MDWISLKAHPTLLEILAWSILATEGIEGIWQLYVDAAHAYRTCYSRAAEAILELADAAEYVWPGGMMDSAMAEA